jgi:hypothetical protein
MNKKLAKASVLLFLLAMTLVGTALAQTVTVGVAPGNTFQYNYRISWGSTDPSATVPSEYVRLNQTQYIRLNIVSVDGTQINVDFTRHFTDGTEDKQNGNINVNTQVLEIPYSVMIIRAGANSGEKIYPVGGHATLNETATRSYSIGQVETIRYVSPEATGPNSERTEIFYDRANGVGLEYNLVSSETSGSYVTTTTETLMITSWTIPEFPSVLLLLVSVIAISILIVAVKKKHQHSSS